jgi:hypothetical protein
MYTILTGEPEGMRTFGRCGRIWEDNIKMDLGKQVGRCGLNSSGP